MFKNMRRFLLMAMVLVVMVAPINALAATTLDSPCTNLSASIEGTTNTSGNAYSGSASTGTVTMTVSSLRSAMNGTLTLTNSGSDPALLSFSYTVSGGYSTCTIAGNAVSGSGTYSAELAAGESLKIYMVANTWTSLNPAKVTLTNVKLEVTSAANITVSHNEPGTVSVNGTTITSGDVVEVEETGATFVATPASGAVFLGWINTADNSVVSTAASFNHVPTGDVSLKAIFAHADYEACFWGSEKGYLFESLSAAITHASSASNKTIILAASGTLSSGSYTIPSGVTLLAPFDANGTLYTTSPGYVKDSYTTPSAYSTLTMAAGANITVASGGAISVSAKVSAKMGYAGAPTSKYGHIDMNAGSSITVNSGGNLYAWGYITGSGNVTIKSGATVYESFQVVDWRGGTASSGMLGNSKKVFPMTQYYVQNVEAPMTLEYGASEQCSMVADIISVRQVTVQFLGGSGCMFNLTSGTVTKRYDGSTDRLILDVNGEISLSSTEIEMVQYLYYIDLADYVVPLNGNITINVDTGGTLIFNQDASLLPGAEVNIAEGTTVEFAQGKRLFVYDETEWKKEYYVYSSAYFRPVRYAHSKTYTRTADKDIIDAKILVNGTLDASAGYLYTTSGGANICSTANGVVKVQAAESSPTLYGATQSGTTITYASISIVPAWLKNEDATYIETSANTYYYDHHDCEHGDDATHGVWHPGEHTVTSVVTAPTCTEAGYTTYTCACDHSYTTDEVAAAGHKWSGGSCTVCGATRPAVAQIGTTLYYTLADAVEAYNTDSGYIQMLLDSVENEYTIKKTVYLDLNGCDVSGVSVASGGTLYGMDSKTDGYESGKEGSITLSSGTVAPVTEFKGKNNVGNDTATLHRYLAVKAENVDSWSFHRYNLSVGEAYYLEVLSNNTAKIGVSAYFRGNSTVRAKLSEMGFSFDKATPVTTALSNPADPYTLYYTSGAATMTAADLTLSVRAAVLFSTDTNYYYSNLWTVDFVTLLQTYYQDADANAKAILESFATVAEIQLT